MKNVLTKCIDRQVQDLTLSDKTSTNSPDPTSFALLLFSMVELRRKETGVKRYSLQKRAMCIKRSSSPRMTTTSVSDPGGPLSEKGLWGLGTITSPRQSFPSFMISSTGMRPNAVSTTGGSEGLYNQQHLKYILGVMSYIQSLWNHKYSECDDKDTVDAMLYTVSIMSWVEWTPCHNYCGSLP